MEKHTNDTAAFDYELATGLNASWDKVDSAELTPELEAGLRMHSTMIRNALHPSTYLFYSKARDPLPIIRSKRVAQHFLISENSKTIWIALAILLYAIIRAAISGITVDLLILSIWGLFASIIQFIYVIYIVKVVGTRRINFTSDIALSWLMIIFPFLLALYLILFKGVFLLMTDFSLLRIIKTLILILLGHTIAKKVRITQEFHSLIKQQISSDQGIVENINKL